jgi:SAM-dependent methyltransferase
MFSSYGFCVTCDRPTHFTSETAWFRDDLLCSLCGSIPRERALMFCLEKFCPQWRTLAIHESSPASRGASSKLEKLCPMYSCSQLFPDSPLGSLHGGVRCEDLENMTFPGASFDVFVTQDVCEHVYQPEAMFQEISRVLRPGGLHVFTTPLVRKFEPSEVCAERDANGNIAHLTPPEYHGSPVGDGRVLVTRKWGYDICDFIYRSSAMQTTIFYADAIELGIRAEYIEVLVSRKSASVS